MRQKLKFINKKYILIFSLIIIFIILLYNNFLTKKDYNVLFFTLDTTRADYIDTGEGALAETPNIKEIAKESIVCKNAYTTIPITMPAHSSIFTGKYPFILNVFNNGEKYTSKYKTLAEIFKLHGYSTGAVISLGVLHRDFGLSRGFDFYFDDFTAYHPSYYLPANIVTERGLKLLEKLKNKKFFIWLHYSDPHEPYAPPSFRRTVKIFLNKKWVHHYNAYDVMKVSFYADLKKGKNILQFKNIRYLKFFLPYPLIIKNFEIKSGNSIIKEINFENIKTTKRKKSLIFLSRRSNIIIHSNKNQKVKITFKTRPNLSPKTKRFLYKKEVEYMDKEIGKIIKFLKENNLYKKTVIVFVGDHGEGLGEYHLNFGHIYYLRPQYTKVPLIMKFPGKKHRIIEKNVSVIDIYRTLLDYFSFKEGKENRLSKNILKNYKGKRKLFMYTYKPESIHDGVSVLEENFQFIMYRGKKSFSEFIDLSKTNGYTLKDNFINAPEYFKIIKRMKKTALKEFKIAKRKKKQKRFSDKTKEILESLGYL